MKIFESPKFHRLFLKYVRSLSQKEFEHVKSHLRLFKENWQNPKLRTHKLKNAKGKWAFTVLESRTRSDRIVFVFQIQEMQKTKEKIVVLLAIGSHDVVYKNLRDAM